MFNKSNLDNARKLRNELTDQERNLWFRFLRGYPLKWYKQRTIDNYIVDFYCPKAKLAVELDGGQHYENEALHYDDERTKVLESYGVKVIRFDNVLVERSFDTVCEEIDRAVQERCGFTAS